MTNYLTDDTAQLVSVLDLPSPYRVRLEACGFVFLRLAYRDQGPERWVRGTAKCMCGEIQAFNVVESIAYLRAQRIPWDPWHAVYRTDIFTPEHLRADGFPEDVISRAAAVYYGATP